MPEIFHTIMYWIYWGIAAFMGVMLLTVLFRERDRAIQSTVALLLVPVILRVLGIK